MSAVLTASAQPILSPSAVIDTPAMLVDEQLMEQNISEMQALANSLGAKLRPHIKTHKTPQVALRQIAAGAAVSPAPSSARPRSWPMAASRTSSWPIRW